MDKTFSEKLESDVMLTVSQSETTSLKNEKNKSKIKRISNLKVHKGDMKEGFTTVDNRLLRFQNLSLKAKGFMCLVLSLPPGWRFSISGLASICKERVSAIRSALDELEKNGFLKITKRYPNQTDSGQIEYEYTFFEFDAECIDVKVKKQDEENMPLENHYVEKQLVENKPQINNDYQTKNNLELTDIHSTDHVTECVNNNCCY